MYQCFRGTCCLHLRVMNNVPANCSRLHGITSQKIIVVVITTMRITSLVTLSCNKAGVPKVCFGTSTKCLQSVYMVCVEHKHQMCHCVSACFQRVKPI
jgi:hypothetical protein